MPNNGPRVSNDFSSCEKLFRGGGGRGIPFYGAMLASPTHPPLSAETPDPPPPTLVGKQMTVSLFLLFKSLVLSGWGLSPTHFSLFLSLSHYLLETSAKVNCLLLAPDSLSPHYIQKISHLLFLSPIFAEKVSKSINLRLLHFTDFSSLYHA